MRKVLIPILIMIFLVGCGKKEPAVNADHDPVTPTVSTQPQSVQQNPILKPADSKQSDETEPTLTEDLPQSTTPAKIPVQETVPTHPTAPPSTTPKPTEPTPTETKPQEQPEEETAPPATEPEPLLPTVPEVTAPAPTEPAPTEPPATEPAPTEPKQETIDTAALEAYARSYASSAYGYNGTSACGPGSGAGYFPGVTKEILTMADGYSLVCRAIDAQYARDIASGYAPYEEIDGVTVRCPINVRVEPTGQANMYVIWVYYGGA